MYKLYTDNKIKIKITNKDIINHINKINDLKRKEDSLVAYSLLEYALMSYGINDFEIDFSGKPKLINSDIFFNISHDDGMSAVVLSKECIGVDLMHIRKINKKIIDYIINPNEKYPENDLEYTTLWCMKESYIKYSGKAISSDMKLINTNLYKYDVKKYDDFIVVICTGKK